MSKTEQNNPFDFVGELHNAGLDYVLENLSNTKSEDISPDTIEELTDRFCENVFAQDARFSVNANSQTKACEIGITESQTDTTLSESAVAYYDRIVRVAETNNYTYIKNEFHSLEQELLSADVDNLTEYDRMFLLCTISIGKHSNEYWNCDMENTKGFIASLVAGDLIGAAKGIAKHGVEILVCGTIGGIGCGLAATGKAALGPAIAASAEAGILYGASQL